MIAHYCRELCKTVECEETCDYCGAEFGETRADLLAERDSLKAQNEALVEALEQAADALVLINGDDQHPAAINARAALAAARGGKSS